MNARRGGFSLLETAVALAVGGIALAIAGSIMVGGTRSVDYVMTEAVADADLQRVMGRIVDELHRSSPGSIDVTTAPNSDAITLQTSDPAGGGAWGAMNAGGVWVAKWSLRYRREGDDLVRETLGASGNVVDRRTVLRGLDSPVGGGEKGFSVEPSGSVYLIGLGVRRGFSDGVPATRRISTSVFVEGTTP